LKVSPEPVTRPVGRDRLKALYEPKGVTPDKEVIAYRRIGERSSHSWFVLKYLLGFPNVKNYDGSWTEWGNLVRTPIQKPQGASLLRAQVGRGHKRRSGCFLGRQTFRPRDLSCRHRCTIGTRDGPGEAARGECPQASAFESERGTRPR
jgi:hypothetical protein